MNVIFTVCCHVGMLAWLMQEGHLGDIKESGHGQGSSEKWALLPMQNAMWLVWIVKDEGTDPIMIMSHRLRDKKP